MDGELYSTIEYSPGWYYKKWPGFYNEECYRILSMYSHHPEKFNPAMETADEGVEETKDSELPQTEEQSEEQPEEPQQKKIKIEEETV